MKLSAVRLDDLETLLVVCRHSSISKAARELHTTPSHVSKAVRRLETELGGPLLERSTKGVAMNQVGLKMQPELKEWLARLAVIWRSATDPKPYVTLAANSFLTAAFLPRLAAAAPEVHWRGVNLSRSLIRAHVSEGIFDLALAYDSDNLPEGWSAASLGAIRHGLFAAPGTARRLGRGPIMPARIATLNFVVPVALRDGKWLSGDDQCPLGRGQRGAGCEVETVPVALDIAAGTEQVVFAPLVAAAAWLRDRRLVEVAVTGWNVRTPLHLLCNAERVRWQQHQRWLSVFEKTLTALDVPSSHRAKLGA